MDPIKMVLGEDHQGSMEIMKYFLGDFPEFKLVGCCEDGQQLVEEVMVKKPDLVLTDIKMPRKNGIEAIKECLSFHPNLKFIFLTGYAEYGIEAFEMSAVDYIVKPIEKDRLETAMEKVKNLLQFEMNQSFNRIPKLDMLSLKDHHSIRNIPIADIYFIEKYGKKSLIHTQYEIYETNETIANLLSRLDGSFFQTHRSYIINLNKVAVITPQNETFIVHFKNYDKQAGISKLKINEVRDRLLIK